MHQIKKESISRNKGSIDDVKYFSAPTKCGMFAPLHKVVVSLTSSTPGHIRINIADYLLHHTCPVFL